VFFTPSFRGSNVFGKEPSQKINLQSRSTDHRIRNKPHTTVYHFI